MDENCPTGSSPYFDFEVCSSCPHYTRAVLNGSTKCLAAYTTPCFLRRLDEEIGLGGWNIGVGKLMDGGIGSRRAGAQDRSLSQITHIWRICTAMRSGLPLQISWLGHRAINMGRAHDSRRQFRRSIYEDFPIFARDCFHGRLTSAPSGLSCCRHHSERNPRTNVIISKALAVLMDRSAAAPG